MDREHARVGSRTITSESTPPVGRCAATSSATPLPQAADGLIDQVLESRKAQTRSRRRAVAPAMWGATARVKCAWLAAVAPTPSAAGELSGRRKLVRVRYYLLVSAMTETFNTS